MPAIWSVGGGLFAGVKVGGEGLGEGEAVWVAVGVAGEDLGGAGGIVLVDVVVGALGRLVGEEVVGVGIFRDRLGDADARVVVLVGAFRVTLERLTAGVVLAHFGGGYPALGVAGVGPPAHNSGAAVFGSPLGGAGSSRGSDRRHPRDQRRGCGDRLGRPIAATRDGLISGRSGGGICGRDGSRRL